jgi:hypothetical protein
MSPDTRISASCSPDVVGIARDIRAILRDGMHHSPLVAEQAMREAADALESMMRRVDAMREECAKIAESHAVCGCKGAEGRCMIDDAPLAIAEEIRALPRAALSDGIEQRSDTD